MRTNQTVLVLIVVFLSGYPNEAICQESFISVTTGYGFPIATSMLYQNITIQNTLASGQTTLGGVYGSFGAGFNAGLSYTRMFRNNMGVELGVRYLFGSQFTGLQEVTTTIPPVVETFETTATLNGFFITPVFAVQASSEKIRPYGKVGFTLGFPTLVEARAVEINTPSFGSQYDLTREYTGGPSLGFVAGGGVTFAAAARFRWFAEVIFTTMTFYPDKSEVTSHALNNINQLPSMSVSQKERVFVDEFTISSTVPQNPALPSTELRQSFPLSSLQLSFGMRFMLSMAK